MSHHPTMQALVLSAINGSFQPTSLRRPAPGPGEVLVRIHASGVNPLDGKIRAGLAAHARHPLPAILGIDMAGVVEAVGEGVEGFQAGDAVYGMVGGVGGVPGTLAEYAAVPADLLARKPRNLSMRDAAALPLAVITAWEGLVDRAHLQPGQSVLVLGGSGAVGQAAIQIARSFGAEVFATAAPERQAMLAALGATPLDRSVPVEEWVAMATYGQGFDVAYDTAGGASLDAGFAAVRRFGHVVSALGWGSHALAPLSFKAASYSGVFTLLPLLTGEGRPRHGAILAEASRIAEAGQLALRLDPRHFDATNVAAAHAALTDGTATGKLVVSMV